MVIASVRIIVFYLLGAPLLPTNTFSKKEFIILHLVRVAIFVKCFVLSFLSLLMSLF